MSIINNILRFKDSYVQKYGKVPNVIYLTDDQQYRLDHEILKLGHIPRMREENDNLIQYIWGMKIKPKETQKWTSIDNGLPPMFKNVIDWGRIKKFNISCQAWQGRRWTGWRNGWPGQAEGKEPPFTWHAPCDYRIKDVTHWMPLPKIG